ncbi:MAG: FmdB family zinc ribbon protein [Burkholderiales bacterium]
MPIYEYRCSSCGHEKDVLQKMSDPPLTICPACGKSAMTKQVTAAGFQLKGSGWYATDFKGAGKKPAAKDDSSENKTGSAEGKSESKTDASAPKSEKSESKPKEESKPTPPAASGASPA